VVSLRLAMLVLGARSPVSARNPGRVHHLWAPSGWTYAETIVLLRGGHHRWRGQYLGAVLGALLVPLAFEEVTRFIPGSARPA